MRVYLAGFNVDTEVLRQLQEKAGKRGDITPEVISAAYARISRDPRPINEIRDEARTEVEKSRKSNSTIIFKMGHHSVAEHAVFNLDILGVSRLVMEEVEKFRLCSYTEKSQRYITLDKDFVTPEEIKETGFEKMFTEMIREQNKAYFELFEKLKVYVFKKNSGLAQEPKILLPILTAATMEEKSSSSKTRSEASRATSVPLSPIAIPIFAAFKAGASLTPSPVIATISPLAFRAFTIINFCSGTTRANTFTVFILCRRSN